MSCILLIIAGIFGKIYNSNDDIKTNIFYWICTILIIFIQQIIAFYIEKEKDQKDKLNESTNTFTTLIKEKDNEIEECKIKSKAMLDEITNLLYTKNDNSQYIVAIFLKDYKGYFEKNKLYNIDITLNCLKDDNIFNDLKIVLTDKLVEIKQEEFQKINSTHILKNIIPNRNAGKFEYSFKIKNNQDICQFQKCCFSLKIKNEYKNRNLKFCLMIEDYETYSSSDKIYYFDIN